MAKKTAVKNEVEEKTESQPEPSYGGFNMDESAAKVKKALKIVIGLIVIVAGIYGVAHWWSLFLNGLKAAVGVIVILIGLLVLFLGISD